MIKKPTYEELEARVRSFEQVEAKCRAEQIAYKKSIADYRTLFDSTNDAIFVHDLEDGSILDVNLKGIEMYGYTKEEMLQLDAESLGEGTPPYSLVEVHKRIQNAARGEQHLFEWKARKKNGDLFWVEVSPKKVNLHGEERIIAIVRDISKCKQCEIDLKSQRDRFEYILEGTNVGTWEWNVQTGETIVNERWVEIIGHALDEISPTSIETWIKYTHPDDLEKRKAALYKHFSGESDYFDVECRMKHKDGHWVWVLSRGKVISFKDDGEPIWMYGTHQDITERKLHEESIQKAAIKYKTIIRTTIDGFWLTDLEGRLLEVNDAYCRMSGYSETELLSMHIPELEGTMGPDEVTNKIQEVKNQGHLRFETKHRRKSGSLYHVEVVVQYLAEDNGRLFIFLRDISERKKSEEILHHLTETWNLAQRAANIGHWSYDIKTRQSVWSDQMYKVLGCDPEKGVPDYKAHKKIIHTDDWKTFDEATKGAIKGTSYNIEVRTVFPDGGIHWCNVQGFPRDGQHGNIIELFGTTQDITERRQAVQALRFTQYAIDNSNDQAFWMTEDGALFYVNDAASRSLGYSRRELMKLSITDLDPAFSPEAFALHWRDLREHQYLVFETSHRAKGGRVYPVEIRANYVVLGGKEYNCAFATDITKRKRMEQTLRESESFRRALFQTIPDLVWLKDRHGVFLACNQMFERLLGTKEENIVGKTDYDFVEKDLADFFLKHDQMAIAAGKPISNEEWITFADDGHRALLETIKTPMLDSQGKLIGVLGVGRDITERKNAEEEKIRLEKKLIQAQKIESIGRLAGGVAHDFNNMLNVILGFGELALEQVDPTQSLHTALQEIIKAAKRSADISRQLLAFARKQTIDPQVLDLNETVADMLKMIRRLIGEDINLTWLPGKDLWPIKMDPSQLDQILVNLCVNARDAIQGVGKLTIETGLAKFDEDYCKSHPVFVPGEFVQLSVSDDGCGMDKDTLQNIFEPFFTTKGMEKGTGLGLATVYGIVKQNEGFINVYSEPNIGTTFRIYFRHDETYGKETVKRDNVASDVRGGETILVVEDEPAILNVTKMILENLGYRVLVATKPRQAIDLAREHDGQIHLLITDVVMPEMNGLELARNLLSLYPNLKHLFMSGYTANIIAHHGVLDEGINFISKPFSKKDLSIKVQEALTHTDDTSLQ